MPTQNPDLKAIAFGDVERELRVTRRVLDRLPAEHLAWRPHAKSMTLAELAWHVADMPSWMRAALAADELDASDVDAPPPPADLVDPAKLLARFDRNADQLREAIVAFDMAVWDKPWTMRKGNHVITRQPRPLVFRVWSVNHMVHHRAQLCVYLRLLDVPVPTVYFNTSDQPAMTFD